ncbi:MAG: ATP-binding protein [Actinomycetota bacterium]
MRITVEGEPRDLPSSTDHAAYRILQESLTNVLRHAGPDAQAEAGLRYAPGFLTLTVTDDGSAASGTSEDGASADGASADGGGGHGLHGMSERAAAVGGELAAGPRGGGGFAVTARLPLVPTAAGKQPPPTPPAPASREPAPDSARTGATG